MDSERTLEEIKEHRYSILPDEEMYQVIECEYSVDFETPDCTLVLIIRHKSTGNLRKLQFSNVALNNPELAYLRDATGLYFIDTSYLNWSPDQRIEVGDTDGGPPLFWAEAVEEIHE